MGDSGSDPVFFSHYAPGQTRAVGVTQSGDVLITNDLYFPITLVDHAECCTGTGVNPYAGGYETGTGTGGTPYMQEQSSSSESSSSSS